MNPARLLVLLVSLPLLLGGCKKLDRFEPFLEWRGKKGDQLAYLKNSNSPYTGKQSMFLNGKKSREATYREGKQNGLEIYWNVYGSKIVQLNWKNDELHGLSLSWYYDGQKEIEATYKDGKQHGIMIKWHSNGQKQFEKNYNEGELISSSYWNKKGIPFNSEKESVK